MDIVYIIGSIVLVGFAYSMLALALGILWPLQLVHSKVMTIRQFKIMLNLVFEDKNFRYDAYNVMGAGYSLWYCNGYFSFHVNDVTGFSAYQKYLFFKRFRNLKRNKDKAEIAEKLKLHQLSPAGQVLFQEKK